MRRATIAALAAGLLLAMPVTAAPVLDPFVQTFSQECDPSAAYRAQDIADYAGDLAAGESHDIAFDVNCDDYFFGSGPGDLRAIVFASRNDEYSLSVTLPDGTERLATLSEGKVTGSGSGKNAIVCVSAAEVGTYTVHIAGGVARDIQLSIVAGGGYDPCG